MVFYVVCLCSWVGYTAKAMDLDLIEVHDIVFASITKSSLKCVLGIYAADVKCRWHF